MDGGEWYDYSPRKAAEVLELAPEDYEVDDEHQALLLRRLPYGLSLEADASHQEVSILPMILTPEKGYCWHES